MNNFSKRYPTSSGIDTQKKFDDLFLFGYQSTIFNDDEKALYVDQGKHLIPWMGDESLLIDRYDGRGHLSDLTAYDADLTKGRWQPLNDREKQIESMLDEERFYELNNDVYEKMLYEEEELKRLSEALADNAYSAVGFNYYEDQQNVSNNEEKFNDDGTAVDDANADDDDDSFVMPSNLNISADVPLPKTMKEYAIIERTALFVSKQQGSQMEIIIKTKQSTNPLFHFLDFTSPIYLFYRQLVELMKSGKFVPLPKANEEINKNQHNFDHESPHKEVHISSSDFLQSIQDKLPVGQIANTPYAKLLSNLIKLAPITTPSTTAVTVDDAIKFEVPTSSTKNDNDDREDESMIGITLPPPPPPPIVENQENIPEEEEYEDMICHHLTEDLIIQKSDIIPPPPDQQPIIDKMAEYVIRNGPEFEELVKMKKDKRFGFLEDDHPYKIYYTYKKNIYFQNRKLESNKEDKEFVLENLNSDDLKNTLNAKVKLVDYDANESSNILVSYNEDSDDSGDDIDDDNQIKGYKIVDYQSDVSDEPTRKPKSKIKNHNLDHYNSNSDDNINEKVKLKSLVNYEIEKDNLTKKTKSIVSNYNSCSENDVSEHVKKEKSTDCDSALIPLLCVHR